MSYNYAEKDKKYINLTKKAIQWMQSVITMGREWRYKDDKPSVPQMYPNMNKNWDPQYSIIKNNIAEKYGEITMGWYISEKHRNNAHKHGITNIRDPRCTIDIYQGIKSRNSTKEK